MLNEEIFDLLTPQQIEALKLLADALKMTPERDMVFGYKNEFYYPTKFGFVNVITVNREKEIKSLRKQLEDATINNKILLSENHTLKDCLKDGGKSLYKIVKITDEKMTHKEMIVQIRKYLQTLIR